jgi:predicted sulfurtransferase
LSICFHERNPIEYCNKNTTFLLKLTIKVRDKIVADGLVDKTFDVTNIGIHLKAKEFNELLEDPNTIVVDMRKLRGDWSFTQTQLSQM